MSRTLKTAIGLILTAIMLFPVYWMVNVSFTKDTDMRADPPHLFPFNGTLEGYRAVLHQQMPYLGTSLLIGLGTVVLTVASRSPSCGREEAARSASSCSSPR
jgi:multiple sugar transport system permease protein